MPGPWNEIAFEASPDHPTLALAEAALVRAGARSILEQRVLVARRDDATERERLRLVTYFGHPWSEAVDRLERELAVLVEVAGGEARLTATRFGTASLDGTWKPVLGGVTISPRLHVRPAWEPSSDADGQTVTIDPGAGFGTGAHPTTVLCLRALDALAGEASGKAGEGWSDAAGPAGRITSMLDVGCGSGVLSIAAARLGLGDVAGLDIDPLAVETSARNAALNGVRCRFTHGTLDQVAGRFDLVVANLRTPTLVLLREALLDRATRLLAVSGVRVDEEDVVHDAFVGMGCRQEGAAVRLEGWSLLRFARPAA